MTQRHCNCVGGIDRPERLVDADEGLHHLLHLLLVGAAVAGNGALDLVRGIFDHITTTRRSLGHHDAARLPDRHRGADIHLEEDALDGHDLGRELVEQGTDIALELGEPDRKRQVCRGPDDPGGDGSGPGATLLDAAVTTARQTRIDPQNEHTYDRLAVGAGLEWDHRPAALDPIAARSFRAFAPVRLLSRRLAPLRSLDNRTLGGAVTWEPEIAELRHREALAARMGGADKVRRHHDNGRLTVRERIASLLDEGSFHEIGALAGRATYGADGVLEEFRPANFVCGRGRVDGRPIVVGGDDFTVRGGAADASIWAKQVIAEQAANELGLPLVRLVDGTGGGGSVKSLDKDRRTYIPENPGWQFVVDNLAAVPVVALGLGSVAGLGAARFVSSHLAVMVRETSQVFVAGPPVVARLGEDVTKEELGGAGIHGTNGVADVVVDTEEQAFDVARRFLSYLPRSVEHLPPRTESPDPVDRRDETLISAIPRERRRVYKVRPIIESVIDSGSFFEMGAGWGRSAVTGLARLDGWPVAVLANDTYVYGGGWTADASQKVQRFVDLADTFHLPVVHLVDQPGFVIGTASEEAATIRHGSRALAAVFQAEVPWCTVILRKVFGVAGAAHQNTNRLKFRYAWPSADWGSLPLEGGIEAAFRADLDAADDRDAMLAEITERMNRVRSPFRTAEAFLAEEIIDPRDTRPLLCEFANLTAELRRPGRRAWGYRP